MGGQPKTTTNPLERFVAPEFRNAPNLEIHPSAKNLRGALTELGARVPRLVPTRQVLINAGINIGAEGGGMAAGFFAGSEAGKAMSKYFSTHPPTNRTDEYGQALATSMVALGVGNLVSKVVTYVIRQGARAAMGAEIAGSISSAGAAGASAILEAVVFATIATTTQFYVTKSLEDQGHSHAYSRAVGSLAATDALMAAELVAWLAKGGPVNLAADVSLIASELFIVGFGIYSFFEEWAEGKKQDEEEAAVRAEREKAEQDRRDAITRINTTNNARADFMLSLAEYDYDFDALYDTLNDYQKDALDILNPEQKIAFQRQIESSFDPFNAFQEPQIGPAPLAPILSPAEKDRRDVFNSYINWYIAELRGETQPPFNFDDPKVKALDEYSGGTWRSAAQVTATTNYTQSERVHPYIENAQKKIIDAFHNERKTIEEMDSVTVQYALLDPTFRGNYEAYITSEAQAQILLEFNNTQFTYRDMDPKLVEIAMRDPDFQRVADAYYQTLANQARDYEMSISQVAHLNSLMENDQAIEIGKLNDARNAIIQKNLSDNQAAIDAYNANILREINIYGDNFESIIRNINEQSLLSGHTFLYASNRADLYRQLHLEMPELDLVDPGDEIDDQPDATWHPAKGRKVGDTALYGYKHGLVDEQYQELLGMIARGEITWADEADQAILIRERDRYIYEETDQERAASLNMTLTEYYSKFGIPVDPYQMEIVDIDKIEKTPTNGRVRQSDGTIFTYRNGVLVNKQKPAEPETPTEPEKPTEPSGEPTYEQLKIMYPVYYRSQIATQNYYNNPDPDATIELNLRKEYRRNPLPIPTTTTPTDPETPTEPETPTGPTYEQLQVTYPDDYLRIYYGRIRFGLTPEEADAYTEEVLRRDVHEEENLEILSPDQFKTGIVNMPDGSTRTYKNGFVVKVVYPVGYDPGAPNAEQINEAEGIRNALYSVSLTPEPVIPPTPTIPLQQGVINMLDGSKRIYRDGKVISVSYPPGKNGPTIHEINDAEGVRTQFPDPVREQRINNVMTIFGYSREAAEQYADLYEYNRLHPKDGVESLDPFREPTFEDLQIMYGPIFKGTNNPEQNYRILHADNLAHGGAAPLPTSQQILEARQKAALEAGKPEEPPRNRWEYVPETPLPPQVYDREPTFEELVQMYGPNLLGTTNAEQNYRILHADEMAHGTAPPLPTQAPAPAPAPAPTQPTQTTQPTQPTRPAGEPTYEQLQVMYPASYRQYTRSYANEARYTDTPTSPERQAEMMELLLRAEHTNRLENGTAAQVPAPTTQPTPAPAPAPAPATATTTPSGAGPSDYRPRQAEPMQINNP
jgi:hypothetical protein